MRHLRVFVSPSLCFLLSLCRSLAPSLALPLALSLFVCVFCVRLSKEACVYPFLFVLRPRARKRLVASYVQSNSVCILPQRPPPLETQVSRVLGMLRNQKMAVAFHTFLEAAEASIAEQEQKRLAMLNWLYPGLQVCLSVCVCVSVRVCSRANTQD